MAISPPLVATLAFASAAHAQFHALIFTRTVGFRHDSIPAGIAAIQSLAAQHCFTTEASENPADFNPANLARFRVVIFLLTTGDILDPMQQLAFEQWLSAGKGWVGVHSASDTEYTWPFYGQMLGGAYFSGHPNVQQASIIIENAAHPSTSFLPTVWVRTDEWYNFQVNPRPSVQVLARIDESTYTGGTMGPDHPIAWFHTLQGGQVFYTAGGHTIQSYTEPLFVQHLAGAILWAAQSAGCACYANCDSSTAEPVLNVQDFTCFLQRYAAGENYANCDQSSQAPTLNVQDFTCFLQRYAAGCP
jgi:type 1 glutamine amidotransferase